MKLFLLIFSFLIFLSCLFYYFRPAPIVKFIGNDEKLVDRDRFSMEVRGGFENDKYYLYFSNDCFETYGEAVNEFIDHKQLDLRMVYVSEKCFPKSFETQKEAVEFSKQFSTYQDCVEYNQSLELKKDRVTKERNKLGIPSFEDYHAAAKRFKEEFTPSPLTIKHCE